MSMFGVSKSAIESTSGPSSVSVAAFVSRASAPGAVVRCSVNNAVLKAQGDPIGVAGKALALHYYNQGSAVTEGAAAISEFAGELRITGTAGGDGANCYMLPWFPDKVCMIELRSMRQLFITANLDGCAIFIAGGRCNPTICHANIQMASEASASNMQSRNQRRNGYYDSIVAELERRGLDSDNRVSWLPGTDYTGKCGVYGVRGSDMKWTFYASDSGTRVTTKIWPA